MTSKKFWKRLTAAALCMALIVTLLPVQVLAATFMMGAEAGVVETAPEPGGKTTAGARPVNNAASAGEEAASLSAGAPVLWTPASDSGVNTNTPVEVVPDAGYGYKIIFAKNGSSGVYKSSTKRGPAALVGKLQVTLEGINKGDEITISFDGSNSGASSYAAVTATLVDIADAENKDSVTTTTAADQAYSLHVKASADNSTFELTANSYIAIYSITITPAGSGEIVPVESVTLDKTTLSLTVGESATLTATVEPEDATNQTVTWGIKDDVDGVVSVEGGVVTAVGPGTAIVTATAGGVSAECSVTVTAAPEACGCSRENPHQWPGSTLEIAVDGGQTHYIDAPADATSARLLLTNSDITGNNWAVKSGFLAIGGRDSQNDGRMKFISSTWSGQAVVTLTTTAGLQEVTIVVVSGEEPQPTPTVEPTPSVEPEPSEEPSDPPATGGEPIDAACCSESNPHNSTNKTGALSRLYERHYVQAGYGSNMTFTVAEADQNLTGKVETWKTPEGTIAGNEFSKFERVDSKNLYAVKLITSGTKPDTFTIKNADGDVIYYFTVVKDPKAVTVTYKVEGRDDVVVDGEKGKKATGAPDVTVPAGKVLKWYVADENGAATATEWNFSTNLTGDLTLVAKLQVVCTEVSHKLWWDEDAPGYVRADTAVVTIPDLPEGAVLTRQEDDAELGIFGTANGENISIENNVITATNIAGGTVFVKATVDGADTYYKVVVEPKTVTVTFQMSGSVKEDGKSVNISFSKTEGGEAANNVTRTDYAGKKLTDLRIPNAYPLREGYVFAGWDVSSETLNQMLVDGKPFPYKSEKRNLKGEVEPFTVRNLRAEDLETAVVTQNVTLIATAKKNASSVTIAAWDRQGNAIPVDTVIDVARALETEDYGFSTHFEDKPLSGTDGSQKDTRVCVVNYMYSDNNMVDIDLHFKDGNNYSLVGFYYPASTKENANFVTSLGGADDWRLDNIVGGGVINLVLDTGYTVVYQLENASVDDVNDMPLDVEVYFQGDESEFGDATVNGNAISWQKNPKVQFASELTLKDLPTAKDPAYVVNGWRDEDDTYRVGLVDLSGNLESLDADDDHVIVLTAIYELKGKDYYLVYDANKPAGVTAEVENLPNDRTANTNTGSYVFGVRNTPPTLEGYVFQGWSLGNPTPAADATLIQPGGQVTLTDDGSDATEFTATLYAVWKKTAAPSLYNIYVSLSYGTGEMAGKDAYEVNAAQDAEGYVKLTDMFPGLVLMDDQETVFALAPADNNKVMDHLLLGTGADKGDGLWYDSLLWGHTSNYPQGIPIAEEGTASVGKTDVSYTYSYAHTAQYSAPLTLTVAPLENDVYIKLRFANDLRSAGVNGVKKSIELSDGVPDRHQLFVIVEDDPDPNVREKVWVTNESPVLFAGSYYQSATANALKWTTSTTLCTEPGLTVAPTAAKVATESLADYTIEGKWILYERRGGVDYLVNDDNTGEGAMLQGYTHNNQKFTRTNGKGNFGNGEGYLYVLRPNLSVNIKYTTNNPSGKTTYGTVKLANPYSTSASNEHVAIKEGVAQGATATPRTGYEFKNWTDAAGNEVSTNATFVPGKDETTGLNFPETYKANFVATTYKIQFDLDGGEPDGNYSYPETYTYFDSISSRAPVKRGYTFLGWTGGQVVLDEEGNELHGEDWSDTVAKPTTLVPLNSTGDRRYIAHWEPTVYTITYNYVNNKGGDWPEGAVHPTTYTVETPTFTVTNPVSASHDFDGWWGTDFPATGAKTMIVTVEQGSIGNRTYDAYWKEKTFDIQYSWTWQQADESSQEYTSRPQDTDGNSLEVWKYLDNGERSNLAGAKDSFNNEKGKSYGTEYTVARDYVKDDVAYTLDDLGNKNGVYTFSGWQAYVATRDEEGNLIATEETATPDDNGVITLTCDLVVRGVWTYQAMTVPEVRVRYHWNWDEVPHGAVYKRDGTTVVDDIALPAHHDQTFRYGTIIGVDNTYSNYSSGAHYTVYVFGDYGNLIGAWSFNGWYETEDLDANGAKNRTGSLQNDIKNVVDQNPDDSDKWVLDFYGEWTETKVAIPTATLSYAWVHLPKDVQFYSDPECTREIPAADVASWLPDTMTFSNKEPWPDREQLLPKTVVPKADDPENATKVYVATTIVIGIGEDENGDPYEITKQIPYQMWTFDHWGATPSGNVTGNSHTTVYGYWSVTRIPQSKYRVTYQWEGDLPYNMIFKDSEHREPKDRINPVYLGKPNWQLDMVADQTHTVNTKYTDPDQYAVLYEKDGATDIFTAKYTFSGWTPYAAYILDEAGDFVLDEEGNIALGPEETIQDGMVTITDHDVVLKGVWTKTSATITYKLDDDSLALGAISVYNSTEKLAPDWTYAARGTKVTNVPANYSVIWKDAGKNVVGEGAEWTPEMPEDGWVDTTYTAYIEPTKYAITYDVDGGSWGVDDTGEELPNPNPASYTVLDDNFKLKNPSKVGYTFAGWTGTKVSAATAELTVDTSWAQDLSYTANWTAIPYDVTYVWTGLPDTLPELYSASGDKVTLTKPAGLQDQEQGTTHEVDTTYTEGYVVYTHDDYGNQTGKYTFGGWDKSGTLTINGADITITGAWTYAAVSVETGDLSYSWTGLPENATLYGADDKETSPEVPATATYKNGQDYTIDTTWPGTVVYTKDAYGNKDATYTLGAWDKEDGKMVGGSDVAVSATWTYAAVSVETYTVRYDLAGGTTTSARTVFTQYSGESTATIVQPVRTGYTFQRWSPAVAERVTGDATYVAQWTPIEYSITYDLNDGALADGETNPTSYTEDTETFTLNNPTKADNVFVGWTGSNGTTAQTSVSVVKGTTGDLSYVANWLPDRNHNGVDDTTEYRTVTYKDGENGNVFADDVHTELSAGVKLLDGDATPAFAGSLTRAGYTFVGWTPTVVATVNGDATYTATWKKIPSGGGGGGGSVPTPTPPEEEELEDPDVPLADLPVIVPTLNSEDHMAYLIGRPDGSIAPLDNITRGEVATIFFRLLTEETRSANWSTSCGYVDMDGTEYYNNPVSTATKAGLIKGYEDGTFGGGRLITRAEMATIAARFLSDPYTGEDLFDDIGGHWAQEYINRAATAGWFKVTDANGAKVGNFRPNDYITRAEVVVMINRMLGRRADMDHLLPGMKTWPDNVYSASAAWYYVDIQEATNSHDYQREIVGAPEVWTKLNENPDWAALERR